MSVTKTMGGRMTIDCQCEMEFEVRIEGMNITFVNPGLIVSLDCTAGHGLQRLEVTRVAASLGAHGAVFEDVGIHEMAQAIVARFGAAVTDAVREARTFPLLHSPAMRDIPWALIEPHASQAVVNHGQDLETLARRGGIALNELAAVLQDEHWSKWLDRSEDDALIVIHGHTQALAALEEPNGR